MNLCFYIQTIVSEFQNFLFLYLRLFKINFKIVPPLRRTLLTIAVLLLFWQLNAQKQANYWYFGENAGISFSLGPPSALTNGALNTGEGCSSISTAAGNLEFYTDGRFVYHKNHGQMPNGFGLLGNSSSTQSGIIIPKPGSSTEYYVFTVDAADNNLAAGLCYTKVDMTLNNGLGDVVTTEKNISLVPLACEKVTAVGHSDGYSFWVITKKWGNADFYAYRITGDGVSTTPVISTTGPMLIGDIGQASKGYLKVSPDGTKIAMANNTDYSVGIYNFDNATGIVTHMVTDENYTEPSGFDPGGPYGVEFSPNSKVLYIGEWKANRKIHQYDLSSEDPATILASRVVVASVGQGLGPIGALQLGPDNRMYIARRNSTYLSRINQPNVLGTGCGFIENAVGLAGRECSYGLPPFIQSFFFLSADFYWDEPACDGDTIQFYTSASDTPDSVRWTFPNGTQSTELNPTYLFPTTGLYGVQLKVYLYGISKNVARFVRINPAASVNIGSDTTICASEAFYLNPGAYNTYQWQNDSTSQTLLTDTTGWYWCRVTNQFGCPAIDSAYIVVNQNPETYAGPDASVPEGNTITLQGEVDGGSGTYTYQWIPAGLLVNPNILQPVTVPMTTTTTFTLTATDTQTGCTGSDQVFIEVIGGLLNSSASASPPIVCSGSQTQLNAQAYGGTGQYSFSWTSNPVGFTSDLQNPVVAPLVTTTYFVEVFDGETTVSSQVIVDVNARPLPNAGPDQVITYGTPTQLSGTASAGTGFYQWQWAPADKLNFANIQNPTTVNLYESVSFTLSVTDLWTGCTSVQPDVVLISLSGDALAANPSALPAVICSGESTQLYALAGGGTQNYTYSWTSNPPGFTNTQANPIVSPTATTTYQVTVSDGFNNATGSIEVLVNSLPSINLIPNDPKVQPISANEIGVCVFDTVSINAADPAISQASYLWSNGATTQSIDVLSSGISFDLRQYNVEVTNLATGCKNTADIIIYFTFSNCSYGIDEPEADNRLSIYPNPAEDGILNYSLQGVYGEVELEIFTQSGKLVHSERFKLAPEEVRTSGVPLAAYPAGIYFIRLTSAEALIHKKFLIK